MKFPHVCEHEREAYFSICSQFKEEVEQFDREVEERIRRMIDVASAYDGVKAETDECHPYCCISFAPCASKTVRDRIKTMLKANVHVGLSLANKVKALAAPPRTYSRNGVRLDWIISHKQYASDWCSALSQMENAVAFQVISHWPCDVADAKMFAAKMWLRLCNTSTFNENSVGRITYMPMTMRDVENLAANVWAQVAGGRRTVTDKRGISHTLTTKEENQKGHNIAMRIIKTDESMLRTAIDACKKENGKAPDIKTLAAKTGNTPMAIRYGLEKFGLLGEIDFKRRGTKLERLEAKAKKLDDEEKLLARIAELEAKIAEHDARRADKKQY